TSSPITYSACTICRLSPMLSAANHRGALCPTGRRLNHAWRSAGFLVERLLDLRVFKVVLGDGDGLGANFRGVLCAGKVSTGLLDRLRADVGWLLGNQGLHLATLELFDLCAAGVEADDHCLAHGVRVAHSSGRTLRSEQVSREDPV